ncbi:restriction endonuclease subunit S [Actinomyces bouchesdurhonensis]|uniref:restriction endonuclease subunit S n=1 Tax=Actinomyces bouchesdurhonensis TaxID=1852361 RepID=UPI0028E37C59|nr:restriction endonuclease subunit S [Actinomyces bouchesdurhonensis]
MSRTQLKAICHKGSSSLRQKDVANDGPYAIYGAPGIIGYSSTYQFEHPYLAVVKDGAGVGRVMVCEAKSSVLGTMQAIKPNDGVDLYYLQHLLKAMNLSSYYTGATIPHIYFKDYGNASVSLPSLSEQKAIAAVFRKHGQLVEQYERMLEMLDELVKSRFVEMFGDPIDESSPWPKLAIKDFCTLKIGPFGSSLHKQDYITGGHPLVNPSHIADGKIVPANDLTISEEKYQEMEAYHLEPGDVVLGRRGEIGRCAVVYSSGYLCGTGSMIVRPSDKCRPDYLQRVLSFPSFKDALERNAVGQTMKNLNAKIVGQAVVALPSINAQNEFAAFGQQVDKLEFETQQAIDKLQTLYDSLAQEYFGE